MMIAYLVTDVGQTIGLVSDGDGLRWESETPGLAERAARIVRLEDIPEAAGQPAAYAVQKLKEFIPGESCVIAGNIAPDGFYKRGASLPMHPAFASLFAPQPKRYARDLAAAIAGAVEAVDTEPTVAQQKAGNYAHGHVVVQGLDISIENPKGSTRSGKSKDGKAWSVTMGTHYGYLKRTRGADGDHCDVFLGPDPESQIVFVVDQAKPDGSFDEHKIGLGFTNEADARAGYLSNYSPGWKCGPIRALTMAQFKLWLAQGDTSSRIDGQPIFYAKSAEALTVTALIDRLRMIGPLQGRHLIDSLLEMLRQNPQLRKMLATRDLAALQAMGLRQQVEEMPRQYAKDCARGMAPAFARLFTPGQPRQYAKPWDESKVHRGQPENAGEFGPGGGKSDSPAAALDHAADHQANGTRSKAFKAWFGDWEHDPGRASKVVNDKGEPQQTHHLANRSSQVVDPNGKPVVVYHGTKAKDFDAFDTTSGYDLGAHFGPIEQAQNFVSGGENRARIYPVYLNIKNPLRIKDLGGWDMTSMTPELRKVGIEIPPDVTEQGHKVFKTGAKAYQQWSKKTLAETLQKAGYDGIVYLNAVEGIDFQKRAAEAAKLPMVADLPDDVLRGLGAKDSWIILDPGQAKSAIGNRGTFDPKDTRLDYAKFDESKIRRDSLGKFAHKQTLEAMAHGETREVGGLPVKRQGAGKWRLETPKGHVEGDSDRIAQHIDLNQSQAATVPGGKEPAGAVAQKLRNFWNGIPGRLPEEWELWNAHDMLEGTGKGLEFDGDLWNVHDFDDEPMAAWPSSQAWNALEPEPSAA